jgi:hypothetical protein
MEISFATEELKEACLARHACCNVFPAEVLEAVHVLYNAMRNAEHMEELPFGCPDPASLEKSVEWTVDLVAGFRARMRVNHLNPPNSEGKLDLSRVHRVQFVAIEGPNG